MVFGKLDGLSGIAEDTFVYGEAQHDQHILNVLDTARENNVGFNPDKFQFKVNEASFFGVISTSEGIKPDEGKVKALRDMLSLKNLTELQSFMGMILNRFSPDIRTWRTADEERSTICVAGRAPKSIPES